LLTIAHLILQKSLEPKVLQHGMTLQIPQVLIAMIESQRSQNETLDLLKEQMFAHVLSQDEHAAELKFSPADIEEIKHTVQLLDERLTTVNGTNRGGLFHELSITSDDKRILSAD
jgi:uncharacterized protein YjaZ